MIRSMYAFLPPDTRRAIRLQQRLWQDVLYGHKSLFIQQNGQQVTYPTRIIVHQLVRPGVTLAAKLHNIRKAIDKVEGLPIPPGKIFSFWHVVGNPGKKQGFLPGRNIINGRLIHDYGGGLCQISSAMYELALRSGMTVLERHAHSTNVYTPETTYTPLGLDCTLAYGYKDLRLKNNFPFPVCFSFQLSETDFSAALCAPEILEAYDLRVVHETNQEGLTADVWRKAGEGEMLISKDFYKAWEEAT